MPFKRAVPPKTREEWLTSAMTQLRRHFADANFIIPKEVRVSCGLPSHGAFGTRKRVIGQAWSSTSSRDKHHEIFISPTIDDPMKVLGVLVHELVHVTVGIEAGHKGMFIECARAVGLNSPWTSTSETGELLDMLKRLHVDLGNYPHASLSGMTNGKKKQGTRLIKVGCPHCGYTMRSTITWLLTAVPTCPVDTCDHYGETFEVEWPEANPE